jgi:hypothetical protein
VRGLTAASQLAPNTRFQSMARYLLVLHDLDDSPDLIASARELADSDAAAQFVLLVPAVMLGPIDALIARYSTSVQMARERAQRLRAQLFAAGLHLIATRLGKPSPLQALEDALRFSDYAAVVIAGPPQPLHHWLRRDLACRAAARFPFTKVLHATGGSLERSRALLLDSDPASQAGS